MRIYVIALGLALALGGCASSGVIRGTLSMGTPAGALDADSGGVWVTAPVRDAVVYIQDPHQHRPEEPVATPRALYRMELRDQEFRPRILAVPVGSSVEFTNNDTLFHNVFSVSPARRFDLGRCGRGKTRRLTFEKPGLVKVYCNIHSNMAAYILVVSDPTFARPDSLGHFALPRLPRGKYVVNVWHPDFPVIRRDVIVSGGQDAEIVVRLGS